MNLKAGIFIKSSEALDYTFFSGATIYIVEFNPAGAIGFMVSKPAYRSLNQLEEFKDSIDFPIYLGGPVDQEHLFIIHCRPDIIEGGILVADGIYYGGQFSQALEAINSKLIDSSQIKIFIGYCGWNHGELEAEIEEGSWEITGGTNKDVFQTSAQAY